MRKPLTLFLIMMAVAANARQIMSGEAEAIASDFLNSSVNQSNQAKPVGLNRVKAKPGEVADSPSPYYVFNADSNLGFVIVAGDDNARKILGYSDTGSFSFDNLPPALDWMLSVYSNCIGNINNEAPEYNQTYSETNWENISPLISSNWGQGEPYNNGCPIIDGIQAPTGCVATAIAQIVNFHKWPDCGEGIFSYQWNKQILSYDFNANPVNWSIIPDLCDENTSPEAISEIGKLIYSCGIGLEMYYTTGGSGSGIAQAKRFLLENMKYSNDMKIVWPYNYSATEWRKLIYDELSQNRPVYMEGDGHAFVCDGYIDDGYFHFNWGWGGEMDGYFLLNDLTPYDTNYWIELNALINITERKTEVAQFSYDLYNSGGIFYDKNTIRSGKIWNPSRYEYNGYIGVEAVDISTGISTYLTLDNFNIDGANPMGLGVFRECKSWEMSTDNINLPTGTYKLYSVFERAPETLCRFPVLAGAQDYIELNVDADGNHIYSNPTPSFIPDIEISDILFVNGNELSPDECNSANIHEFSVYFLLHNNSDYPVPMPNVIVKNELGNEIINDGLSFVVYEPNKISQAGFTQPNVYMRPGRHTLTIIDFTGKKLVDNYEFSVLDPGPNIGIDGIKDLSVGYGTETSAMEVSLIMNTPWMVNIPCLVEFSQQGEVKFEATSIIDYYPGNEAKLILEIPSKEMLQRGEYDVVIYDLNYNHPLHAIPLKVTFPQCPELSIMIETLHECQIGDTFAINYETDPFWPAFLLAWSSSDELIASVDKDGIVTANAPGEAIITVSCGNVSASCTVTVTGRKMEGDLNSDGILDMTDANILKDHIEAHDTESLDHELADMNHDGIIDMTDVNYIKDLIIKN